MATINSRFLLIDEPFVKVIMRDAVRRSHFGPSGGREVGAYILRDNTGNLDVEPWQSGLQHSINPTLYPNGKIDGKTIVASFHTHPNTSVDYIQEPSRQDIKSHIDNPRAWGEEYVISQENIYLIEDDGTVIVMGDTTELLEL